MVADQSCMKIREEIKNDFLLQTKVNYLRTYSNVYCSICLSKIISVLQALLLFYKFLLLSISSLIFIKLGRPPFWISMIIKLHNLCLSMSFKMMCHKPYLYGKNVFDAPPPLSCLIILLLRGKFLFTNVAIVVPQGFYSFKCKTVELFDHSVYTGWFTKICRDSESSFILHFI